MSESEKEPLGRGIAMPSGGIGTPTSSPSSKSNSILGFQDRLRQYLRWFLGAIGFISFLTIGIAILFSSYHELLACIHGFPATFKLPQLLKVADGVLVSITFTYLGFHTAQWYTNVEGMDLIDSSIVNMVAITAAITFLSYFLSFVSEKSSNDSSISQINILLISISISIFIITLGWFSSKIIKNNATNSPEEPKNQ